MVRITKEALLVATVFVVGSASQIACKKTDAEKADVGAKVQAPWSREQSMYPGKVTELYGKLARVDFDDGHQGWVLVDKLQPAGSPQPAPADTCSVANGDRVSAPWSRTKQMYPGKITEVHGKLAHVNFDDGEQGWALCSETQKVGSAPDTNKVKAPWGRGHIMYSGKITEIYGKLARVDFDDGDQGWALVDKLDPPRSAEAMPPGTCSFNVGDTVRAPWDRAKSMYKGKLSEVYGKLAHVDFDDGETGWALCSKIEKP